MGLTNISQVIKNNNSKRNGDFHGSNVSDTFVHHLGAYNFSIFNINKFNKLSSGVVLTAGFIVWVTY